MSEPRAFTVYDRETRNAIGDSESLVVVYDEAGASSLSVEAPQLDVTPPGIDPGTGMRYRPEDDPMRPLMEAPQLDAALLCRADSTRLNHLLAGQTIPCRIHEQIAAEYARLSDRPGTEGESEGVGE